MSRHRLRRRGLLLLGLLAVQAVAMPIAGCAQAHAEHGGGGHAAGHDVDPSTHDMAPPAHTMHEPSDVEPAGAMSTPTPSAPSDCVALARCGAPVFRPLGTGTPFVLDAEREIPKRLAIASPAVVDLGAPTPPPKI